MQRSSWLLLTGTSLFDSKHKLPPLVGLGLVQLRCIILKPPPHVALQGEYSIQLAHSPSTVKSAREANFNMYGSVKNRSS